MEDDDYGGGDVGNPFNKLMGDDYGGDNIHVSGGEEDSMLDFLADQKGQQQTSASSTDVPMQTSKEGCRMIRILLFFFNQLRSPISNFEPR